MAWGFFYCKKGGIELPKKKILSQEEILKKQLKSKAPSSSSKSKQLEDETTLYTGYGDKKPPTGFVCPSCGTIFTSLRGNFYMTDSDLYRGNGGHLPLCRKCIYDFYIKAKEIYEGDDKAVVKRMCQLFDVYWNEDCYVLSESMQKAATNNFVAYLMRLRIKPFCDMGKSYFDTVREEKLALRQAVKKAEESAKVESVINGEEVDETSVSPETIKRFGPGFTLEQYAYLQDEYDDWITRNECKTKAQETLFKELCICQLSMRVMNADINADGNTDPKVLKTRADALKTFQDLLGASNLKPTQTNDSLLVDTNSFGTLISKWEKEKPVPEPDPEWADVDNIKSYISTWFLGHLCKMFNIDNDWSQLYEKEKSKYTVEPPHYDEMDEEELDFDALLKQQNRGGDANERSDNPESKPSSE
ncbi:MAG TPA: hypothetical protein PLT28_00485 [Saprospiraceae bacterium]|nr:hypothetical protein [Saprospiraceae bacterium]